MKTKLCIVIITVLLVLASIPGIGQTNSSELTIPASKDDSMLLLNYQAQREYFTASITLNQLQAEVNRHKIRMLYYRERRLEWHAVASNIIFFVVIIIVLAGILFSGIQFYKSLIKQKSRARLSASSPVPEVQKISLSLKGIELSSSVLGVVILVISIAFFYLYLAIVYPINDLDGLPKTTAEVNAKK